MKIWYLRFNLRLMSEIIKIKGLLSPILISTFAAAIDLDRDSFRSILSSVNSLKLQKFSFQNYIAITAGVWSDAEE